MLNIRKLDIVFIALDNIEIIILEPGICLKFSYSYSFSRIFIESLEQLSNKPMPWDLLNGREKILLSV